MSSSVAAPCLWARRLTRPWLYRCGRSLVAAAHSACAHAYLDESQMRGAFRGPVTCIGSFGPPFQDSVATPPSPAPRGWGRGRLEVRGTRWLAIAGSAPTTDGRAAVALCGRTTDQMADSGRGGGRLREPRARGSCVPSIRRGGTSAASICSKRQLLLLGPPSRYEEDLFAVFGLPAP